jgi:hypothetical protein
MYDLDAEAINELLPEFVPFLITKGSQAIFYLGILRG